MMALTFNLSSIYYKKGPLFIIFDNPKNYLLFYWFLITGVLLGWIRNQCHTTDRQKFCLCMKSARKSGHHNEAKWCFIGTNILYYMLQSVSWNDNGMEKLELANSKYFSLQCVSVSNQNFKATYSFSDSSKKVLRALMVTLSASSNKVKIYVYC